MRSHRPLLALSVVCLLLSFHFIFSRKYTQYKLSMKQISDLISHPDLHMLSAPRRANATLMMLARNADLAGVLKSVHQVEVRFNGRHNYPWVLLNDEPFNEDFMRRVRTQTTAPVSFGLIQREHWLQPPWINNTRAAEARKRMGEAQIPYGGSLSYRNMCRFNSGFFFKHELLQQYRYYWRVEPDIQYFCDLDYDPFLFMQERNINYGFTISLKEYVSTIPTLWDTVLEFIREYPHLVPEENMMRFLSDNGGNTYNLCHYWSNFEIGDMEFWRGDEYSQFFDFLDRKGGFYYERWGDAPVHSIAVSLFLRKEQTHFFDEIGYRHEPFEHCPTDDDVWVRQRCSCDPRMNFDTWANSCIDRWRASGK